MRARVMMFAAIFDKNMWVHNFIHANWVRYQLPASRINGKIPTQRLFRGTRVDYFTLFEFRSPGFAFIYRSDTAAGKQCLTRYVRLVPWNGKRHEVRQGLHTSHKDLHARTSK